MNNHTATTIRRLTVTSIGLAALVATTYAPVVATTGNTTDPQACNWTADQLPRTPDAVDGWYRGCQAPHLGTPDATEGWLR